MATKKEAPEAAPKEAPKAPKTSKPKAAPVEAEVVEVDEPTPAVQLDVIGEDGRRVVRWHAEAAAREFAHQLTTRTGETLKLVPSDPR